MNRANDPGSTRFSWSSLKPKLSRLLESPSPHIRANLASLAAAMAEDHDALDELAKIGGDAATGVISQRGDMADLLATVLRERSGLSELDRKRFDRFFQRELETESANWEPKRLPALLGGASPVPVDLLPLKFVLKAVFANTSIEPNPKTDREFEQIKDQRVRLAEIARAAKTSEDPEWFDRLAEGAARELTQLEETPRDAKLFALLELWPELARAIAREKLDGKGFSLIDAARVGRGGGFWKRLSPIAATVAIAVSVLFALPHLGGLPLEGGGFLEMVLGVMVLAAWSLVLVVFGLFAATPILLFYTPNAALPLAAYRRILLNAPAILFSSLAQFVCFYILLSMGDRLDEVQVGDAFMLVLALATLVGGSVSLAAPLAIQHQAAFRRGRHLVNRFTIAAIPLVFAAALLAISRLTDSGLAALVWAALLSGGIATSAAAWLGETRRQPRLPAGTFGRGRQIFGAVTTACVGAIVLISVQPLFRMVGSMMSSSQVVLDLRNPEREIKSGVIYRVRTESLAVIEVSQARMRIHNLAIDEIGGGWANQPTTTSGFSQHTGYSGPFKDKVKICLDCWNKTADLADFVEFSWPFHDSTDAKVVLLRPDEPVKSGAVLHFGEVRSFVVERMACLLNDANYGLWPKGSAVEGGSMPAASTFDAVTDAVEANVGQCAANERQIDPGGYRICFYRDNDNAADCDPVGRTRTPRAPGSAEFRLNDPVPQVPAQLQATM